MSSCRLRTLSALTFGWRLPIDGNRSARSCYNRNRRLMHLLRPRPLTAAALSLWIGFLACVLGCAQPVLASPKPTQAQFSEPESAARGDAGGTISSEGPCCHHSRGSQKDKQPVQSVSCCPLDATLLQKQDAVSLSRTSLFVAAVTLLLSHPVLTLCAAREIDAPHLAHTGRDLLLQTRLLRI
jgi:hypothetical protein